MLQDPQAKKAGHFLHWMDLKLPTSPLQICTLSRSTEVIGVDLGLPSVCGNKAYQRAVVAVTEAKLQRGVKLRMLNGQSVIVSDALGRHMVKAHRCGMPGCLLQPV